MPSIVAQIAESSGCNAGALHQRGRNGFLVAVAILLPPRLKVAESKQLVLDNRPPQGHAELLPAGRRDQPAGNGIWVELCERISGCGGVGSPEPESTAVQIVAARLSLYRHRSGNGLAELGVIIAQRYFGFLNGIQIRIYNNNSQNRILIVSAIQFECGAAEMLAIHKDLLAALRIFRRGMAPSHQLLSAGRKQFERCKVPVKDGRVL